MQNSSVVVSVFCNVFMQTESSYRWVLGAAGEGNATFLSAGIPISTVKIDVQIPIVCSKRTAALPLHSSRREKWFRAAIDSRSDKRPFQKQLIDSNRTKCITNGLNFPDWFHSLRNTQVQSEQIVAFEVPSLVTAGHLIIT